MSKLKFKNYWGIVKETFINFNKEDSMNHSASIAFYTIFSLPAVIILIIFIAGTFFGREAVEGELYFQIKGLVGENSALTIQQIVENASKSEASYAAKIISIFTLLFSSMTVFLAIQNALNSIWRVKPKPRKGYIKFLRDRFLSFAMIVCLGFLMLVSLAAEAIIVTFQKMLMLLFSEMTLYVMNIINFGISIIVNTIIFALIFKVLPDAQIKWRDVSIGAFVTTLLFTLGKYLIGIYLGNSSFNDTYGAAGSFVVILIWVYYSSVLLLFGAQFTHVYSQSMGRHILPSETAVKIEVKEIEKEGEEV